MFEWAKKVVMIIGAGLVIVQSDAKASLQCPIDGARYVLKSDKSYSADFVRVRLEAGATNVSAVALHIRSTTGGQHNAKEFWLGIEQGNGYSYAELYAIADPALHEGKAVPREGLPSENKAQGLPHMPLLTASANMDISSSLAMTASAPAPQFFLVPYLGMNLWYENRRFSDRFNDSNRDIMPLGFFELTACAAPNK